MRRNWGKEEVRKVGTAIRLHDALEIEWGAFSRGDLGVGVASTIFSEFEYSQMRSRVYFTAVIPSWLVFAGVCGRWTCQILH